ncbi:DENN-domain-containing protein [Fragilariopsis cylindrus CCMP1102]|uniref:DENN-domain-containing protein n=1 Tax=Fragilariopsis cylindrus CCMP1102 TaxID=635003 RepID=A0A1E7EXZ3_9STRA|nr:DENN-domain-containing protein [Fragilariopsis cylindrus CCMP1102]|eukprot:OEU10689.1 DENN-domain-containing protein [Fragilariopsis cylindrus CCMP1102]
MTTTGVGKDLVWRHAQQKDNQQKQQEEQDQEQQKQKQQLQQQQHDDDESSKPQPSSTGQEREPEDIKKSSTTEIPKPIPKQHTIPEEDDAMLLERFYREIVTCDIVLVEEEDEENYNDDNNNNTNEDETNNNDTSLINTSAISATAAAAAEGWIVVRKTRPAATNSNPTTAATTASSTAGSSKPPLWNKGKIWDTNLNPIDGLMGEILRMKYQRDEEYEQELDRGNGNSSSKNGNGMMTKNHHYHHDTAKTPLKDLRKRMQYTFQSKTQQWLHHNHPSNNNNSNNNSNQSHYRGSYKRQRRKQFYLTYKRRSPDEPNVPAIADLALYYVRIHKSTIVVIQNNNSTTEVANVSGITIENSANVTATMNLSNNAAAVTSQQVVAAAASAVGRNGIRASAAILNAGRQAVSNRWNNNSNNPEENSDQYSKDNNHHNSDGAAAAANAGGVSSMMMEGGIVHQYDNERGPLVSLLLFPESNSSNHNTTNDSNQGIEAVDRTPDRLRRGKSMTSSSTSTGIPRHGSNKTHDDWKERLMPRLFDPSDKNLSAVVAAAADEEYGSVIVHGERYYPQEGESVIVNGGSASFDDDNDGDFNNDHYNYNGNGDGDYIYVPVLAVRRQRIGDEERFAEDPALIDLSVSVFDEGGQAVLPSEEYQFMTEEEMMEDENDDGVTVGTKLLHKTKWIESRNLASINGEKKNTTSKQQCRTRQQRNATATLGAVCILVRHNVPMGFCDAAFSTRVLDRFPYKNYKGLPLPEEELPMFCYPTGCRLYRAKYSDSPLPQYYGFVVKNERGDSIYVSCVSFMEPLTNKKKEQLSKLSEKRRRVCLPHKIYWARRQQRIMRRQRRDQNEVGMNNNSNNDGVNDENISVMSVASPSDWISVNEKDDYYEDEQNSVLTAFDQMTTYENKTICLISRYPYWTAFRRFLSHLHSVSGCSSDLPLERYISHLLLSVPVPKPGGPNVLIPLPTFNIPMMLSSPPRKDFPLIDLPFERLLACLDVPTIVTLVIGFLALERKVIVMSKQPSLVLDVCECVRALLFPFELVAPYVPRLTEPFMSCLEFPGAIFVGIHDDGTRDGLAATVRQQMPEDSTIVNLDTGSVDCSGDRTSVLKNSWGIIPTGPRSVLVSEIETLCRDASILPGQEPLDGILDAAFEVSVPATMVEDNILLSNDDREPLDDRAVRDAFLRFFCSVLVGYERYLVAPDVNFLISGNEWFDAKGFLDAASEEKAVFLGTLVSTQLFQSFIQRRTEASDVHLLLFDECLQEFHSSSAVPYGRLGGDVESVINDETGKSHMLYSLLVDQAATEPRSAIPLGRGSFDGDSRGHGGDADTSSGHHTSMSNSIASEVTDRLVKYSEFCINQSGDWVTIPSRQGIPNNASFTYCVDGNPTFPDALNQSFYVPRQPESWLVEMSTTSTPMLTRSGPEKDESERRRRFSTSYRGLHSQRKCLWQLPKLMGSHFLGTWLLCIPTLVSQSNISHELQSRYLLRAFGALRLLRSKQKIIPDEAAYRALIVACGRSKNDRRAELVRLFGHLRSDGIFPSAVTLGQYTRALAEDGLEHVVDEHGEGILDREKLRENYPELFYNLWWFCARFQMPLPLAVSKDDGADSRHCCAIISWDKQVAMRGCYSCAKVLLDTISSEEVQGSGSEESIESLGDYPLLSKFNLQGYYSNVWDHPDLSEILVALVQACDKRDFKPVVESVLRRGGNIDCYRTILYLARYQCTSAFHAFFPATLKPCKGYHFWCPMVPLTIFDRLFREAVKRVQANNVAAAPIHDVAEVPLAFRSVFGHLM